MKLETDDLGVCGVVVEDWSIEKSFKPKTITTDYSSWITYISRKAVPKNTPITNTEYWKPLTRLQSQLAFDYMEFKRQVNNEVELFKYEILNKYKDLSLLVESFLKNIEPSVPFANKFGDNEFVGVNQKVMMNSIDNIYHLLEEALGRTLLGFDWSVTPTYIYGEWPTTVHIIANTVNQEDVFDKVKLTINNEIVDVSDIRSNTYSFDIDLQANTNIRLDAIILGKGYHREQVVKHYDSFWLGSGINYTDVMIEANNINFSEGTRFAKNVAVTDGNHIIIVIGESWVPAFIRADMNGIEIEFDKTIVTIDGKNYKVLISKSTFEAGIYNIDING